VLAGVEHVNTTTTLAGQACSMPLVLAPVGLAGLAACRGEVQAARAANTANVPFTLSTVGICSFDEVAAQSAAPFWFQLYMLRDRGVVKALLAQAWEAGCRTLVFTVDLPLPGRRQRDVRHGVDGRGWRPALIKAGQVLARPGWIARVALRGKPLRFGCLDAHVPGARDLNAFKAWVDTQFDPSVTWRDIDWLRAQWPGWLWLKGILDVDDARAAVAVGADGIIVSNHGGRQLDSVAAAIDKLPAIAQAVGADVEVLVDGGARSGVDIFKALALGARGVLIGRPWIWALAAAGERGLTDLLAALQRELVLTMTLSGTTRIDDIDSDCLDTAAAAHTNTTGRNAPAGG
jgi:L-lactate dehydrogenase (cytochrome)